MSDYPCQYCGYEGRGVSAHALSCRLQEYSGSVCGCGETYLYKGESICDKCRKSSYFDFRKKIIRVGDHVAYAGRSKAKGFATRDSRGAAVLRFAYVKALKNNAVQIAFPARANEKEVVILVKDLRKIAVL